MGAALYLVVVSLAVHYTTAQRVEDPGETEGDQLQIINGEDADKGEFPFMVRITQLGDHLCGGSLIRPGIVLTAAHCVVIAGGIKAPIYVQRAVVGDYKGSEMEENEQKMQVIRIIVHEDYYVDETGVPLNDIALLVLKEEATLKDGTVSTITLAEDTTNYGEGTAVTVIGWGVDKEEVDEDGNYVSLPDVLQKLEYVIADGEGCKKYWREEHEEYVREYGLVNPELDTDAVIDKTVCTIDPARKATFWNGDSGGPLFVKNAGSFQQIGLASWGGLDPKEKTYNMYLNVNVYKDWIMSAIDRANEDSWIELSTGGSNGIVHVQGKTGSVKTICNNDVGKDEVAAICREQGFKLGTKASARNYMEMSRKQSYDYASPYGYAKLKCKSDAKIVMSDCEMEEYKDSKVPCFNGEQLAVKCADEVWSFKVTYIQSVARATKRGSSSLRGRVMCRVRAQKYGISLDMKNSVQVGVVIRGQDELRTIEADAKYRRNGDYFVGKFRPDDEVKADACFACIAYLPGTKFLAVAKLGPDSCPDNSGLYEKWLEEQNKTIRD